MGETGYFDDLEYIVDTRDELIRIYNSEVLGILKIKINVSAVIIATAVMLFIIIIIFSWIITNQIVNKK